VKADNEFYNYRKKERQYGPYSLQEIQTLYRNQTISGRTLIRKIGGFDWCPLEECQEIFPFNSSQFSLPERETPRCSLIEYLSNFGFLHLEPTKFEEFVMKIFEALGLKGKLTPVTGDDGIDIELTLPNGKKAIVQCKRYNNDQTIGVKDLRELLWAMVHSNSAYGFFVTTSTFTDQAEGFVMGKNLFLIDGMKLKKLFLLATEAEMDNRIIKNPISLITDLPY
jgi:hypothetical protein